MHQRWLIGSVAGLALVGAALGAAGAATSSERILVSVGQLPAGYDGNSAHTRPSGLQPNQIAIADVERFSFRHSSTGTFTLNYRLRNPQIHQIFGRHLGLGFDMYGPGPSFAHQGFYLRVMPTSRTANTFKVQDSVNPASGPSCTQVGGVSLNTSTGILSWHGIPQRCLERTWTNSQTVGATISSPPGRQWVSYFGDASARFTNPGTKPATVCSSGNHYCGTNNPTATYAGGVLMGGPGTGGCPADSHPGYTATGQFDGTCTG